jgi:inward rectifier potassium channel
MGIDHTQDPESPERDLGFGKFVSNQFRGRFLTRDGQSTGRKIGLGAQRTERLYLEALRTPWPTFLAWLVGLVLLTNGSFALAYRALGPEAISGVDGLGLSDPFMRAFVFSMGVFTTTGIDGLHAVGPTAHFLMVSEMLMGPLTAILASGLIIARLTRPRAQIRFSESAIIAPYEGGRALMFRIVNELPGELTNIAASVNLSWWEMFDGKKERNYHRLELERDDVAFFPLHWTVVHPITDKSPLRGVTPERLRAGDAEILILLTAHEETFATQVTVRSSYKWDEVSWDAKFASVFVTGDSDSDGVTIDVERLSRLERLPEGTTRVPSPAEGAVVP